MCAVCLYFMPDEEAQMMRAALSATAALTRGEIKKILPFALSQPQRFFALCALGYSERQSGNVLKNNDECACV